MLRNAILTVLCLLVLGLGKSMAQCGSVNFKASTTRGCPLLVVKFSATGATSASGATFKWNFGNGFVNGNDTITKAFSVPGQYTIQLQVKLSGANSACPTITKDTFITVLPIPTPVITANPGFTVCDGIDTNTVVVFTDNTPGVTSRSWYINNGSADTAKTVKYKFTSLGTKPLSIYTLNKYGCPGFISNPVQILDSVPVDICASFNVTQNGVSGTFSPDIGATGGNTVVGYQWSFPGGTPSSSTSQNPSVTWPDITKKYNVSLAITTSSGCTYTISRKGFVSPFMTPAFNTLCVGVGETVTTDLSDPNRESYSFNFPSGIFMTPVMDPDPKYGTLSYATSGKFSASISYKFKGGLGCPVTVNYPDFVTAIGPGANFSSTTNQICTGTDTVQLINGTDTSNAPNTRYTWYFFDSTDQKLLPSHDIIGPTYSYNLNYIPGRTGKFGVSLVAKSSDGCSDSVNIATYIVAAHPKGNFNYLSAPIICYGDKVAISATPTPPEGKTTNYKYKWWAQNTTYFMPPDSGTGSLFSYLPDSLGQYDIGLQVSNGHCSSDTVKHNVFTVIGDLTSVHVVTLSGCLNPVFRTVVKIGHESKYPKGPTAVPTLYHWYCDPSDEAYVTFLTPDSPSSVIQIIHNGVYNVYLQTGTVYGGDTCRQIYYLTPNSISVGPPLSFSVGTLVCPGDTVALTNYTDPALVHGFKWAVSPANLAKIVPSDSAYNASIVFESDTCYNISLSGYTAAQGCYGSDTIFGQCFTPIIPDFVSTTPVLYCAPAIANFVNKSQNATSFIWRFGDGDTLATSDTGGVSHVYLRFTKGDYDVSLTAFNQNGCSQTVTHKTAINIIGPVPLFTVNQKTGCDSLTVHFTNTSKNVSSYYFYDDDGSPTDSLALPTHTYTIDDPTRDSVLFVPTLYSRNDPLCRAFFQDTIKLYRTPDDAQVQNNISVGCAPLAVNFVALSNFASRWKWDFNGDGIIDDSVDQAPVYIYQKPGKYVARLIVSNHGHCGYTVYSDTITVVPNARAGFVPSEKKVCGGALVNFKNANTFTSKYVFDYGDGSKPDTNTLSPHFYFFDPGLDTGNSVAFYPRMIAYTPGGCKDTFTDSIKAYRMPEAGFTYTAPTGCSPLKINFQDTSKYSFAAEWDFDNNGTVDAYGRSVGHAFTSGLYTVKMRSISIDGCVDSAIKVNLVVVNPVPKANFDASDSDICYNTTVTFKNLTVPSDSVARWEWNFGDTVAAVDTSTAQNPSFAFMSKGLHKVQLIAVDNKGCTDSITKTDVYVEDTVPPQGPRLLYVSVLDTDAVLVVYSKSPIHLFDAYKINRVSNGGIVASDSLTDVNDTFYSVEDTAIHTSASSYCFSVQAANQCSKISFGSFLHCTILLTGVANSYPENILNWTPYTGWAPNQYYIFRADSAGGFAQVGRVSGSTTTWTDTSVCAGTYCYYVAAIQDSTGYFSISNKICLKSKYIIQAKPLYMRYATVANNSVVRLQWDTSGYKNLVGYQIGKRMKDGTWNETYAFTPANSYTDTRTSINDSSYAYNVRTVDRCGYTGPESNMGTSILLNDGLVADNIQLVWNAYQNWPRGVKNYVIQVQGKNKKFRNVGSVPGTDTSYVDDSVYTDIDTAYCYRIIAVENSGEQDSSTSNLSCAVLPSRIFVPTAFTPNGDSLNDIWKVSAVSIYNAVGGPVAHFDAKVYDRWGILVFETNNIYGGWDGTFRGQKSPASVYIYMISAEGIDGRHIQLRGNLTLLR